MIKKTLKIMLNGILTENKRDAIFNIRILATNYLKDLILFYRHSTVFKTDNFDKIQSEIILDYHAVEKGLLFKDIRPKFAEKRIRDLHHNLKNDSVVNNVELSQIKVAYQIMCEYFELHQNLNVDISDYFAEKDYLFYKNRLAENYSKDFKGTIDYSREIFYAQNNESFEKFSSSRKSIRNFTGEKISVVLLKKAIELASNAPSVCNRQGSKVYLLQDKAIIDQVLRIQGGFGGYTDHVSQLLILTTNRNYFYTVGERNQMFIDGGMFLMNLLYALHFYKIANCPANWGKIIQEERLLNDYISLPESEKIICMIPIGVAKETFRVTLSKRRDVDELFKILN
jgi:nitroreductase